MIIEHIGSVVVNGVVRVTYKSVTYKDGKKTIRAYDNLNRVIGSIPFKDRNSIVVLDKMIKGIL